ncbi:MAG TPA: sensor histidine kinase [Gemmatimonadales bacterium]|nr:sensor histidine kinase [Gemmatimonadales bacterium]
MARASALDEERRSLLERLISAQDEERRRLARELHDQAGQALAALVVGLRRVSDARTLQEAIGHARKLRRSVTGAMVELGRITRGLHPGVLDDLGLGPALKRHAADTAESLGIAVRVRISGFGPRRLPLPLEIALFRIAQEALTNVGRHAGARRVEISLARSASAVRLAVSDDGKGFDPGARARRARPVRRFGLLGIRERATALGGTVDVASARGRGTTVAVSLPLRPPARARAAGGRERER